jgi:hypothetical protein
VVSTQSTTRYQEEIFFFFFFFNCRLFLFDPKPQEKITEEKIRDNYKIINMDKNYKRGKNEFLF